MNQGTSRVNTMLFSGHMVDLPDRETPRFSVDLEAAAGNAIAECVAANIFDPVDRISGVSSGARGGDILFHEACRDIGLETCLILPFHPDVFVRTSVAGVRSGDWEKRFWKLWRETPEFRREILDLPHNSEAYAVCNRRLIEIARKRGRFHLIALWDGKDGDGPGGTAHMVNEARIADDSPDIIWLRDLQTKRRTT